ncbi:MAG: FtsX-like permease family protein [Bacteroidota bacterium]
MIFKIAWRNIWRSRTRSLVVIGAIIIGVWGVIFLVSFSTGMIKSYIDNAIRNEISHIQIHQPEFLEDREVKYPLEQGPAIANTVSDMPGVEAVAMRTLSNAMISTSNGARGIVARGIDPTAEAKLTLLNEKVIEGEYLSEKGRNPILISKTLADKMGVKLRSKVVLTLQDLEGNVINGAFRIVGLYETSNSGADETNVYLRANNLSDLVNQKELVHEVAIYLNDLNLVDTTVTQLKQAFPGTTVQGYAEISPEINLFNSQIKVSSTIFTVIVMLALIFGIINTMLMAVLERLRELGMLMSIGMNKVRVFMMIVLETLLLGLIAAPLGLLFGYTTVQSLGESGIDLSNWSEGMRQFGISEVIYPYLENQLYTQLALSVLFTAILASIYPALKAIRLNPVEAIRSL